MDHVSMPTKFVLQQRRDWAMKRLFEWLAFFKFLINTKQMTRVYFSLNIINRSWAKFTLKWRKNQLRFLHTTSNALLPIMFRSTLIFWIDVLWHFNVFYTLSIVMELLEFKDILFPGIRSIGKKTLECDSENWHSFWEKLRFVVWPSTFQK